MKKFKAQSGYMIDFRGKPTRVITVINDETFNRADNPLVGQTVEIDGELSKVIAVESFATEKVMEGQEIGLVVEGD